ncbi:MAG: magnesium transporter [Syntrophomonadaceae bacterium]|jgi:magnesium transporter
MKSIEAEKIKELVQGHKLSELRELFSDWPVPDIADYLLELDNPDRILVFRVLPRQISSEVFSYLKTEQQNELLRSLTNEETRNLLSNLRPDDRVNLLEELPGQMTQKLLNFLSPDDLKKTRLLLGYPEESVGRLMTPDYVAVRPNWTVEQALQHIRVKGKDSETINTIYVANSDWKLLDSLELQKFILASPDTNVADMMDHNFVSLSAFDDREEAVHMMAKYDQSALPVLDSEGVLLGVVTFDDVMDVAEQEATEDFHRGAAVTPLKTSYSETSWWELYRKRIVWLLTLVAVNLISLEIMATYEQVLASAIALTFFIPMILGSGGNAGAQSATLMVRALATGDVQITQWLPTLIKELGVGAFLGLTLGVAGIVLGLFCGGAEIAVIVGISMIILVLIINLIGVSLPFLLLRFRLDPAIASNPLIMSIADATGLLIYFYIATLILPHI